MFLLFIFLTLLVVLNYWKLIRPHSYWTRQGVIQTKPVFILGDVWDLIRRKHAVPEIIQQQYNKSQNLRYYGMYQFLMPSLLIRDPELIKQLTVKDFDHFQDRKGFVAEDSDPIFCRSLLTLTGQKWKEVRATVSPTFTSSKMKYIFSLIAQSGEQFANHFLKQDSKLLTVEMRSVVTKFTNDVIANTVFGFDCDSLENPDNEFYLKAQEATHFTSFRKLVVLSGYMLVPKLLKFFKVSLFSPEMYNLFSKVVKENIKSREKFEVIRPDMISLLLEARKNSLHVNSSDFLDSNIALAEESADQKVGRNEIVDEDIVAQALIFFLAGFETVASLISFMSYELAVNQDIQKRLRTEVDDTKEQCNGKLTYEGITSMKYMDMVVSETLRKWPSLITADRICTKPYIIEPKQPGEKTVYLKKNDVVVIPFFAIHRDPQYYPHPECFDPERFSDENKSKITPYTYLPFGTGPRRCVGGRFALLETKILFYYLLSNFELRCVDKTEIPLRFSKKAVLNMAADNGIWLGFQRRATNISFAG